MRDCWHLSDARWKNKGVSVTDLVGDQASLERLRNELDGDGGATETVIAFAGHGVPNAWLRQQKEILLVASDLRPYRGLRVYAHACDTAVGFGRAVVDAGSVRYYLGYNGEVIVYYDQTTLECPKGFAQTVAAGVEGAVIELSDCGRFSEDRVRVSALDTILAKT